MIGNDLGTALAILRIIRRLNQEELSKIAGTRSGTISDYERGKMVPGLIAIKKLLGAMGFELTQLDQTQVFLDHMHSQQLEGSADLQFPGASTDLGREINEVSRSAGLLAARMIRLMFRLLAQRSESQEKPERTQE